MNENYPDLNPPSNEISGRVPTKAEIIKSLHEKQPAPTVELLRMAIWSKGQEVGEPESEQAVNAE